MNPGQIEEDREASLAFWGMEPRTFDETQEAATLAEWLDDMETIIILCHVGAYLQVMLSSRCLIGEAPTWWPSIGDPEISKDFTPPATTEMTLDEMIDAIMGAKVIAFFIQAAAPEDGNDYRLYSPVAEDDHLLIPVDDADEFNSIKQGSMTVLEAVKKFEQLACLCLELVPNEMEKVRRIMKMFRTDIAKQVSTGSSPPTLVADCISRAIRAEYWINQDKEARAQIFKVKKKEKTVLKQSQHKQNQEFYSKGQTSNADQNSKQFRRYKRKENASNQRQQRNYPQKKKN
ncbi:hypothetical protein TIFTF001_017042 [Ficus carica]|uniref:Uncharacterized protein n=1 Tax=Ficus carica TaxID=3494 RepID=A0AA88AKJ4_FICCA|nr:hypothetical protein TIFTF001_017042 [Ficus carica]